MTNNQDAPIFLWQFLVMPESRWRERLKGELKSRRISWRKASLNAGMSAGYVSSLFKEGKNPSIENLIEICEANRLSKSYVLLDWPTDVDVEQILALLGDIPDHERRTLIEHLRARLGRRP